MNRHGNVRKNCLLEVYYRFTNRFSFHYFHVLSPESMTFFSFLKKWKTSGDMPLKKRRS